MSQGQYVALAYGAAFVVVLAYVAIIAAKLVRLQRELGELLELTAARRSGFASAETERSDAAALRP
jgi:CcmD family protein